MKIIATTAKEFAELEEQVKKSSPNIQTQIDTVETSIAGVLCVLKYDYKAKQEVFLPKDAYRIINHENCIMIYTSGKFSFKIEDKNMLACKIDYFIEQ